MASLFESNQHVLKPGDYYASTSDTIIGTVTGSSVVVCLYERDKSVGGMGHFIIPGTIGTSGIFTDAIAGFGITNMEYLLGELIKLGGDRRFMKAKVYGSADMGGGDQRRADIMTGNLQFIRQYFEHEKIVIEDEDLGGSSRQKIYFSPRTGEVIKEAVNDSEAADFVALERDYIDAVFKDKGKTGGVVIFD